MKLNEIKILKLVKGPLWDGKEGTRSTRLLEGGSTEWICHILMSIRKSVLVGEYTPEWQEVKDRVQGHCGEFLSYSSFIIDNFIGDDDIDNCNEFIQNHRMMLVDNLIEYYKLKGVSDE